jgi:predicted nucleic acid-binding protein
VDTNVFIYALSDHPEFGKTSRRILQRLQDGEEAITSTLVLCEVAWVLEARGRQGDIKAALEKILSYASIRVSPVDVDDLLVGATYMAQYGLDFNDAVNLAVLERTRVTKVYTNDRKHLGRVEHIETAFE